MRLSFLISVIWFSWNSTTITTSSELHSSKSAGVINLTENFSLAKLQISLQFWFLQMEAIIARDNSTWSNFLCYLDPKTCFLFSQHWGASAAWPRNPDCFAIHGSHESRIQIRKWHSNLDFRFKRKPCSRLTWMLRLYNRDSILVLEDDTVGADQLFWDTNCRVIHEDVQWYHYLWSMSTSRTEFCIEHTKTSCFKKIKLTDITSSTVTLQDIGKLQCNVVLWPASIANQWWHSADPVVKRIDIAIRP